MRVLVLLTLAVMLAASSLRAQEYQPPAQQMWSENSPDHKFEATQRIMPDPDRLWDTDSDTARLFVRSLTGSNAGSHVAYDLPRLIAQIMWSPDSRYLVMTTVSAGGHSPWHFNAYVYSVADDSLRDMDDVIGLVVAPDIKFAGPHTVIMKTGPMGSGGVDFEHPKSVAVDLDKSVGRMKAEGGKSVGKMGD
jgi:hypothetical protein